MEKQDNTKVILVIVTGLLVISYFLGRGENPNEAWVKGLVLVATAIGLIQLISPFLGGLIVKGWYMIGKVLGWINTRILLTLVFYVIVFPISLIYKLTNKNSLQRKKTEGTVFISRDHSYASADLENIW